MGLYDSAPLPKLQEGAPFKTAGMSPEMIARLQAKGIKLDIDPQKAAQETVGAARMNQLGDVRGMAGQAGEDLYVQRKPGQSPLFTNVSPFNGTAEQQAYARATNGGKNGLRQNPSSGFGVSTIQTPGVEGYMRQLNTLRSLRDDGTAGGSGPRITMIANPDAKGGSTLDKVMSQMDFSGGKKLTADGLDALVGASRADTERTRAGNEAVYQQGSLGVQSRGQDLNYKLGMQNNAANRLNAALQRDYEMQRLQMEQGNKNREFGLQADKAKQEQYGQRDKLNRDALSASLLQYDKDGKATPESQAKVRNVLAKIDGTVSKHGLGMGDLTPDIIHNLKSRAGDAAAVDEYMNSTLGKLKRLTGIDKGGVGQSDDLDNYQALSLTPGVLGQRIITPAGEAPLRYLTGGGVTGLDTQNADAKQRIREYLTKNGGR